MSIQKLLIANRGEIALRIIRSAKKLNIKTVLACSESDINSLPAKSADEVIVIGKSRADDSYLDGKKIIDAALQSGAQAIHPGYGFLSENASFARAVLDAGLIFVGPSPQIIEQMGDKAIARDCAIKAGVPVVPGSNGEVISPEEALSVASDITGYPLLIKASAGGGGKGIRIVHSPEQLVHEYTVARAEAKAVFGHDGVYLERYIPEARHVEVQILGDGKNIVHLFERECSLQRKRQKVTEEAPSPSVSASLREALCQSALNLARMLNYSSAGTIEYLVDDRSGEFFFIEMNTRIQVEHPVTEMVTGIDIIDWMLRIAGGDSLSFGQDEITLQGAAIEMRINAENPYNGFMPSPGTISVLQIPEGQGIRVDTHMFEGYKMPLWYDSLLAKLIIHTDSREKTISLARETLGNMQIEGVHTTIPLHEALLSAEFFRNAQFHNKTLEDWLNTGAFK
ncbi:TPA: acetyl-CoA carboxylase biotin carboxylase subunit [Escherichia coli]|nr:acetyl-CoA carboxylase biotin carboxylase subunit [Escherichia coli]